MYRVIQVSEGQLDGQSEGTGAISGYPATQSMTQVQGYGLRRGLDRVLSNKRKRGTNRMGVRLGAIISGNISGCLDPRH
jgi:hypothetical protein